MTKRNIGIDLLRILACFMVVGIHTTPFLSHIDMLMQSFFRVGLCVFFLISGAFILSSEPKSLLSWYTNRLLAIIIPFLVYSYIHFVFITNYQLLDLETLVNFVKFIFLSSTSISVHFWFVYTIIGLYLIAPVFSYMINSMTEVNALKSFLILLFIHAIHSNYPIIQSIINIPNIFLIPDIYIWLLYFISGGLLYKCRNIINNNMATLMLLFGFIITYIFCINTPNKYGLSFNQFDINASMLIYASGLFLLFVKLKLEWLRNNDIIVSLILYISKHTYAIYLIHILILLKLNYIIDTTGYIGIFVTIIVFFISFIITIILNIPIEYILKVFRNTNKSVS